MKITRTIKTTTANVRLYNPIDDNIEYEFITLSGEYKSKPLFIKAVAKERKDGKTVLGCADMTVSEKLYECTIEDFLSVATPVEKSESKATEK